MVEIEGVWRPAWVRGGRIEEVTWIGKDVLAWCSGMHMTFYHVIQKRQSLRWCPKSDNREGVSCLSGHPTMHVLAFADRSFSNPRIFVLSYPSMIRVSECHRGSNSSYSAICFTPGEHLVSLGSHPTHSITIWCWRTGEKVASIGTPIRDIAGQSLRVASGKPILIAQLGRQSGKLHIWETCPAGKTILFTDYQVLLPGGAAAHHMDWSPDPDEPQLAVVDSLGNVYLSNRDGSEVRRIILGQRCGVCPEYESPSVRWFRGGIVMRTTFCQIRLYRKDSKDIWRKEWYVKVITKPSILSVHPSRNDRFFYHTLEGFLMEVDIVDDQADPVIMEIFNYGATYSFLELVRPWGHHLLAVDGPTQVVVIDCYDGHELARLDLELEGPVTQLLSHPDYPIAAVTSKEGELALLSIRSPDSPFVVARFNLQGERLDLIKFSQSGRNLVVGQRTTGVCYCLSLTHTKPFAVIAKLESKSRIADVLLYDPRGHLKLLVLVVSSRRIPVGRHLILYDLQIGRRGSKEPTCYLELPCAYQFLHYAPDGPNSFVGTPYLSRQIHLLEIKDWKEVNLLGTMNSGHQTRRTRLFTDRKWITSTALDGLVTVRNGTRPKAVVTLTPHHRRDLGVAKAIARPSGDLIIALGYSGSLVATQFCRDAEAAGLDDSTTNCRLDFTEYERSKRDILADYSSLDPSVVEMLLSGRNEGFPLVKDGVKKTWNEWSEEARILEEAEGCSQEKSSMQSDFERLRGRVVRLLNENETCPVVERLPISSFDLDKFSRDQRLKVARDEREDSRLELESSCVSMDRVAAWIKSTFWDTQVTIGRSILAISGPTEVTNYPTTADDPDSASALRLARFFRDSMRATMENEGFVPWKLYTRSKLQLALSRKVRLHRVDERQRMDALILGEYDDHDDDDEGNGGTGDGERDDQLANEGMTTHRFLVPSNHYYSQFELYGYAQGLINDRNIADDCKKLREYFDKSFDEMYEIKEREMSLVVERHERIRYIDSELRLMYGQSVPALPIDPDWNCKEVPNSIIKVLDQEIGVRPYVSESQQELIDREAAEAERFRRILLADDFRERTLMRMMDGVLEVRWEDVIKKDVPKPGCMLSKDPEDYNTEDLLAIRQYEKDVELLESERLRYLRILEAEFAKVSGMLREGIDKFNLKLQELFLVRMRVEAAIQQLNLHRIRCSIRHTHRMRRLREEDLMRSRIDAKRKCLSDLQEQLPVFQALLSEYRNHHEALLTRERTVERKFRGEFPSLGRSLVEVLEKEVKRRPRIGLKNTTASDLVELARSAGSHSKSANLPHDCAEYLKGLESLDARPSTLPQSVSGHHWEHLVRVRRARIELELKIKAQMTEILETERTISDNGMKMAKCRLEIDTLKEDLLRSRRERAEFDCDMEVQLVLKMGHIEIKPTAKRIDAINSILIPRTEIDNVNSGISMAGAGKLTSMSRTINFRRGILVEEWEHRCRRMTIEDLEEEFHTVENVLVTRDIRDYLERKAQGHGDKTAQQLEKELEGMEKNCVKRLSDWLARLEDVEARLANMRRENKLMDKKIEKMNVDRWELEWRRDLEGEAKQKEYYDRRIGVVVRRSKLVRKLQKEYTEILALQTEHELLRLKRFPTLTLFKTLDDEPRKKNVC